MTDIIQRLKDNDITLPEAAAPAANYKPYIIENGLVYISGQVCIDGGAMAFTGKVGSDLTVEQGKQAARLCAVNVLAQLNAAIDGDWSKLKSCVRLGVFVNALADFTDHPAVANGASDLMVAILGDEKGAHARAAVGCVSLPRDTATEVEAIFAVHI